MSSQGHLVGSGAPNSPLESVSDMVAAMTITDQLDYTACGTVAPETNEINLAPTRGAGEYQDLANGIAFPDHRMLLVTAGHWRQEDPIGFQAGDTDLRRYVGNRVTNDVDPSGLDVNIEVGKAGATGLLPAFTVSFLGVASGDKAANDNAQRVATLLFNARPAIVQAAKDLNDFYLFNYGKNTKGIDPVRMAIVKKYVHRWFFPATPLASFPTAAQSSAIKHIRDVFRVMLAGFNPAEMATQRINTGKKDITNIRIKFATAAEFEANQNKPYKGESELTDIHDLTDPTSKRWSSSWQLWVFPIALETTDVDLTQGLLHEVSHYYGGTDDAVYFRGAKLGPIPTGKDVGPGDAGVTAYEGGESFFDPKTRKVIPIAQLTNLSTNADSYGWYLSQYMTIPNLLPKPGIPPEIVPPKPGNPNPAPS
jgi:RHS repeat-associated protein